MGLYIRAVAPADLIMRRCLCGPVCGGRASQG
jgi:hypothetical protein